MTVKRFKVVDIEEELYPMLVYYDGDKELGYDEVCELLNELNNENEQLKYNLSAHMVDLNNYKGKCSALEIENEQLKSLNKYLIELLEKNGATVEIGKVKMND